MEIAFIDCQAPATGLSLVKKGRPHHISIYCRFKVNRDTQGAESPPAYSSLNHFGCGLECDSFRHERGGAVAREVSGPLGQDMRRAIFSTGIEGFLVFLGRRSVFFSMNSGEQTGFTKSRSVN